jgi:hypothetical protein
MYNQSHNLEPIYGVIYRITNLINGKIYIGLSTNLEKRLSSHRSSFLGTRDRYPIHLAMVKYGWDNFIIEVIDSAFSEEELDYLEKYWIKFYRTIQKKYGYNLTEGGTCPAKTEESKRKQSKSMKEGYASGRVKPYKRDKTWIARMNKLNRERGKIIYCLELDEIFSSITEAAKILGASRGALEKAGNGYGMYKKMKFIACHDKTLTKEQLKNLLLERESLKDKKRAIRRKILCVEKNLVFDSQLDATKFIQGCWAGIGRCCKGQTKSYKGYTWKYL